MTSERTLATEPNALPSVWGRGLFLSLVLLQTFNNNTPPIYGSGSHFLPRPGAVLSCASGRGVLLRGFFGRLNFTRVKADVAAGHAGAPGAL